MKKILVICLLLLMFPASIHADVLIEPEDSFYRKHADECEPEKKYYTAIEDVSIYQSPTSSLGFSDAKQHSVFYIDWIYTDENGNQWGLYDGIEISYWVKMNHLEPVYSHDEFVNEHAAQLKEESITLNPDKQGYVILYEYPGSFWISDILDTEWISQDSFVIHQIYIDEQGQRWGYMPYYMQHNGWVNLEDAVAADMPERNGPQVFIPDERPVSALLIAGLVFGLCVITGFIPWKIRKRRNSQ